MNYLVYIFFVISIGVYGQVKGRVIDKKNGRPIGDVNIIIKGRQIGAITDKNGFFSTNLFKENDTLIISHISFFKKQVVVISDKLLIIELISSEILINEASVYSKRTPLRISDSPWVIDYQVINDSIILIAKVSNRGSTLELLNNKRKVNTYQLFNIESITVNCLKQIYIQTPDTAYEIEIIGNQLFISSYLLNKELAQINTYCNVFYDEKQYFSLFSNINKLKTFFVFKENNNEPIEVYNIFNKEEYDDILVLSSKFHYLNDNFEHLMGDIHPNHRDPRKRSKHVFNKLDISNYLMLLSKLQTKSPLFTVNNQVVILDGTNDNIIYFNKNDFPTRKLKLDFPFLKRNIINIIKDSRTECIYYFISENDKIIIYNVDINTGKFKRISQINRHIEEPQIHNNVLYYLQYDMHKDTRELYKLPL